MYQAHLLRQPKHRPTIRLLDMDNTENKSAEDISVEKEFSNTASKLLEHVAPGKKVEEAKKLLGKIKKPEKSLNTIILLECRAMSEYLVMQGEEVPGEILYLIEEASKCEDISEYINTLERHKSLADAHKYLIERIDPANPKTVFLIWQENQRKSPLLFISPVPLVRNIMFVGLVSLFILILASLSPFIGETSPNESQILYAGNVMPQNSDAYLYIGKSDPANAKPLGMINASFPKPTFYYSKSPPENAKHKSLHIGHNNLNLLDSSENYLYLKIKGEETIHNIGALNPDIHSNTIYLSSDSLLQAAVKTNHNKMVDVNMHNSSGILLLVNLIFLLAASAIGSTFSMLSKVKKYVTDLTYDPKYVTDYWARFFLGIVGGLILTQLLPKDTLDDMEGMTMPLLALLGGFSATLVHSILDRLVETVESLIQGGKSDSNTTTHKEKKWAPPPTAPKVVETPSAVEEAITTPIPVEAAPTLTDAVVPDTTPDESQIDPPTEPVPTPEPAPALPAAENTFQNRKGYISATRLNVRDQPSPQGNKVGSLTQGSEVNVTGEENGWNKIDFQGTSAWVSAKYVSHSPVSKSTPVKSGSKTFFIHNAQLQSCPLAPADQIPLSGNSTQKQVATTWNNYGNLLNELSQIIGSEVASAVAILCVESGGKGFGSDGRQIIRFENHKMLRYWGKNNRAEFDKYFKYQEGKSWLGHEYRKSESEPWQTFHGSQAKEWDVLEFARSLDDTAALKSISMGAPQVMGFNFQAIGYNSVQEMFENFNKDIRYHIFALFDFLDNKMTTALKNNDFTGFARGYNGPGQAAQYGEWIQKRYEIFKGLKA